MAAESATPLKIEGIEVGEPDERNKLLAKRKELVSLLRSVRRSLETNRKPLIEEQPFLATETQYSFLWDGRTGRFTERGAGKVHEIFERFGSDGAMDYFQFRAYLEMVGRPAELPAYIIDYSEAWRCYVYDLFGCDEVRPLGPPPLPAHPNCPPLPYQRSAGLPPTPSCDIANGSSRSTRSSST